MQSMAICLITREGSEQRGTSLPQALPKVSKYGEPWGNIQCIIIACTWYTKGQSYRCIEEYQPPQVQFELGPDKSLYRCRLKTMARSRSCSRVDTSHGYRN